MVLKKEGVERRKGQGAKAGKVILAEGLLPAGAQRSESAKSPHGARGTSRSRRSWEKGRDEIGNFQK